LVRIDNASVRVGPLVQRRVGGACRDGERERERRAQHGAARKDGVGVRIHVRTTVAQDGAFVKPRG
jgi:hypothetical protein